MFVSQAHSPLKPVLVFVSSRRQTRLTALDIIAFAAADERPEQFVHMAKEELEAALSTVRVRPKALCATRFFSSVEGGLVHWQERP